MPNFTVFRTECKDTFGRWAKYSCANILQQHNISYFCSIIFFVFGISEKAAEKPKSRGQTSSRGKRGGRKSGSGKGKKSTNVSTHVDIEDENSQDFSDSNANKL